MNNPIVKYKWLYIRNVNYQVYLFVENPPSCIETGYHWIGGTDLIEKFDTDSAEQCQEMCSKENRCNWFTWRDASNPKGCWLLSQKGDTKDVDHGRNQGATGPKSCLGRNIDSENRIFVDI